ncbi:MAG: glycosyltransferase family 9 protein [Bacteroidales bacterium]|nr:glycosyltransferase family 9 protein [Bacteroidales bacterium]
MRLLVIRTSAMGDVALTTPVLRALSQHYPDVEIVLVTRQVFKPFFYSINGLSLFFIDIRKRHKGFAGLVRLCGDISATGSFDAIIDLHDVLRSKILRFLFALKGVPSFVIDKGRREKRSVISGKTRTKLKHSVERYTEAFAGAGFQISRTSGPWIIPDPAAIVKIHSMAGSMTELKIGVAPYAKHKLKMWPEKYMVRLLGLIAEKYNARFFLFGGNEESEKLSVFQTLIEGSVNTAGKLALDEELALMSRLDMMIAMDSSNMHMAALLGTKVVSIWGGTDPVTGFGAWMQPDDHFIRIPVDELTCRPCTIYGKGECARGDHACMNWLTPEIVFRKINRLGILYLPPAETV